MSISSALNAAVSALYAQSAAFSTISNNLANSSTVGYKASTTSFDSLLSGSTGSSSYASGGVSASVSANNTVAGTLTSGSSYTDMAISGSGFFTVGSGTSGSSELYYTRSGDFSVNSSGYITTSSGKYLMGWATDSDGNVSGSTSSSNLTAINVSNLSSSAKATSTLSLSGNLDASASVGDTASNEVTIYDSLGTAHTLTATWTKTGDNEWSVDYSTDDSSASITSGSPVTVTFNSDGSLASTSPDVSSTPLTITGWSSGAADSSVTLDLGTSGKTDGLSQYASSDSTTASITSSQNGLATGSLSGISISDDGSVVASFSNGESRTIYKIAVATFANSDGLTNVSGTLYQASLSSGAAQLNVAGTNGAGSIKDEELESSTTDISTEFSNMMSAQQAYSASAQVMSTAKSMFDTLMTAVR